VECVSQDCLLAKRVVYVRNNSSGFGIFEGRYRVGGRSIGMSSTLVRWALRQRMPLNIRIAAFETETLPMIKRMRTPGTEDPCGFEVGIAAASASRVFSLAPKARRLRAFHSDLRIFLWALCIAEQQCPRIFTTVQCMFNNLNKSGLACSHLATRPGKRRVRDVFRTAELYAESDATN
jgi:hypothetical protein